MYIFKKDITKEDILNKVSELDIFIFYLGSKFKLNKKIRSPLREDINPSFSIFKSSKNGSILYKDHATGESGNCFKFIMNLFNISYEEALRTIRNDIIFRKAEWNVIKRKSNEYTDNFVKTVIKIRKKEFNSFDLSYWSSFGISLETLKKFKVCACKEVYINNKLIIKYKDKDRPIYAYEINSKYKIYRPFNRGFFGDKYRFLSNCLSHDIQGLEQIKYMIGDLLIITKSMKDCMTLYELGYYAIAPQSETISIPENIINDLKKRFKKIVLLYDNDLSGINGATKISKEYDLECIFIPDKKNKDISDFVKSNSIELAKDLIKKLLKNEN